MKQEEHFEIIHLNVSNSRDFAFPFDVHNAQIVHSMGSMVTVLEKFNNFNDGTFEFMLCIL